MDQQIYKMELGAEKNLDKSDEKAEISRGGWVKSVSNKQIPIALRKEYLPLWRLLGN